MHKRLSLQMAMQNRKRLLHARPRTKTIDDRCPPFDMIGPQLDADQSLPPSRRAFDDDTVDRTLAATADVDNASTYSGNVDMADLRVTLTPSPVRSSSPLSPTPSTATDRFDPKYFLLLATLHAMSQSMLAKDVPSYISARSANSIISEARPTRIQAETLSFLNRLLDELLLFIVASSRSLATDRIKTDGVLKVFNNNVVAKDAVLEAELELRTYMQGKKAEGGRVPLGLSATSRWDGTEAFPVSSAYNAVSASR